LVQFRHTSAAQQLYRGRHYTPFSFAEFTIYCRAQTRENFFSRSNCGSWANAELVHAHARHTGALPEQVVGALDSGIMRY
jgi:hypothetical protein